MDENNNLNGTDEISLRMDIQVNTETQWKEMGTL